MAQEAVDFAVNPASPDQTLVLWSNGVIYARGGLVMPEEYEEWRQEAYEAFGRPWWFARHFTRLQVTSWSPLGGYVLREFGNGQSVVHEFGNAQAPGTLGPTTDPHPYNQPNYGGYNIMRSLMMDPAANGNGYVMSRFGRLYRIGIPAALTTNNFPAVQGSMADFDMDWTSKKTVLVDEQGRLYMGNGSVYAGYVLDKNQDSYLNVTGYWQNSAWSAFMRRVHVVDWTTVATKPKGYVLDAWGYLHRFNSPELPIHRNVWRNRSVARALNVQTYPTPFAFDVLTNTGTRYEQLSSTAPTVVITQPGTAGVVTTTTRPYVEWDVTDKEADYEDYTEVHFFHTGTFTPGTTVPAEKQILRGSVQRSTRPNLPMPNGTVGIAVRVTETARPGRSGLVSAWDSETWTQNVTRPGAPTIALTPSSNPPQVSVLITAATGGTENGRIADLEYTDVAAPTEADWVRARYPDATYPVYAGAGQVTYVDREVPAGVARKYRARTLINDAEVYNVSLWSSTSALTTSSIPPASWWVIVPEVLAAEAASYRLAVRSAPGQTLTHSQRVSAALPLDSGTSRGAIVTRTRPRARQQDLTLWVQGETEYTQLMRIIDSGRTFCVQDVLGRLMYCNLNGTPSEVTLRTTKEVGSPYPVGHVHQVNVPVVEVRRPFVPDRLEPVV
jgi:hypothetical protein